MYALWLYTDLLTYMVTGSAVFEKIARGAGKDHFLWLASEHRLFIIDAMQ